MRRLVSDHRNAVTQRAAPKPLDGIRVVEFATLIAGPSAASILASLGADVIKVEPIGGDPARGLVAAAAPDRVAPAFVANNVGKRSVAIDLKNGQGAQIARRLIESADVVIDNYRRGVMSRLGLDPDELVAQNNRLVWITIAGFGPEGSWADRPAVDQIVQAESGMIGTTGTHEVAGYKTGYPAVDHTAAHIVVQAVLALLLTRHKTGQGQRHVVSLYGVALSIQTTPMTDYLVAGTIPQRSGNAGPLSAPADSFRAADGEVMIVAYQEAHWQRLCHCLNITELLDDPRFNTPLSRLRNRDELRVEIERSTVSRKSDELAALLDSAGVMASRIRSYPEVIESEQTRVNNLVIDVIGGSNHYRTIRQPNDVFGDDVQQRYLPTLGQHTRAVLSELGFDDAEVDRLQGAGVVTCNSSHHSSSTQPNSQETAFGNAG